MEFRRVLFRSASPTIYEFSLAVTEPTDAGTGTRTRTPLRERDFKSLASTRFAIPAWRPARDANPTTASPLSARRISSTPPEEILRRFASTHRSEERRVGKECR